MQEIVLQLKLQATWFLTLRSEVTSNYDYRATYDNTGLPRMTSANIWHTVMSHTPRYERSCLGYGRKELSMKRRSLSSQWAVDGVHYSVLCRLAWPHHNNADEFQQLFNLSALDRSPFCVQKLYIWDANVGPILVISVHFLIQITFILIYRVAQKEK